MNALKALPMTEPHEQPSNTLEIRVVTSAKEIERFNRLCQEQHCFGGGARGGRFFDIKWLSSTGNGWRCWPGARPPTNSRFARRGLPGIIASAPNGSSGWHKTAFTCFLGQRGGIPTGLRRYFQKVTPPPLFADEARATVAPTPARWRSRRWRRWNATFPTRARFWSLDRSAT